MLLGLSIVCLGLGIWDVFYTRYRIRRSGLECELSRTIPYLIPFFGETRGIFLGVMWAKFLLILCCVYFKWPVYLAFYVGMQAHLSLIQARQLSIDYDSDAGN